MKIVTRETITNTHIHIRSAAMYVNGGKGDIYMYLIIKHLLWWTVLYMQKLMTS